MQQCVNSDPDSDADSDTNPDSRLFLAGFWFWFKPQKEMDSDSRCLDSDPGSDLRWVDLHLALYKKPGFGFVTKTSASNLKRVKASASKIEKRLRLRDNAASAHVWYPVDNFGTVVGENPTPYGILALWAVNGLSIVYWPGYGGYRKWFMLMAKMEANDQWSYLCLTVRALRVPL